MNLRRIFAAGWQEGESDVGEKGTTERKTDDGGVRGNKVRETCHAAESKKHHVNTLEPDRPLINICVCAERRRRVLLHVKKRLFHLHRSGPGGGRRHEQAASSDAHLFTCIHEWLGSQHFVLSLLLHGLNMAFNVRSAGERRLLLHPLPPLLHLPESLPSLFSFLP